MTETGYGRKAFVTKPAARISADRQRQSVNGLNRVKPLVGFVNYQRLT
jgi:hypothetical protein